MPRTDEPSQQKPRSKTSKGGDPAPLKFAESSGRPAPQTDDALADDDFSIEDSPRTNTSVIRLDNPTSPQRITGPGPQTTSIPPRRTGQATGKAITTTASSPPVRQPRSTTTQQYPPPAPKTRRNVHWLLPLGLGMIVAITLWALGSAALAWGTARLDDLRYGYPRTFQTDAAVGHNNDSPAHPSHFIAVNLHGQIIVVEFMAGDPGKSISYLGPDLVDTGSDLIPVSLEFRDVTRDGKPDMLIHVRDKVFVFVNDGTKFRQATSSDNIHL